MGMTGLYTSSPTYRLSWHHLRAARPVVVRPLGPQDSPAVSQRGVRGSRLAEKRPSAKKLLSVGRVWDPWTNGYGAFLADLAPGCTRCLESSPTVSASVFVATYDRVACAYCESFLGSMRIGRKDFKFGDSRSLPSCWIMCRLGAVCR